jgi:hypothetical protein
MEALGVVLGFFGVLLSIAGLLYAVYTTHQISKGVNRSAVNRVHTLVGRMEEQKGKIEDKNSVEWHTLHFTQQKLQTLENDLRDIFNIK